LHVDDVVSGNGFDRDALDRRPLPVSEDGSLSELLPAGLGQDDVRPRPAKKRAGRMIFIVFIPELPLEIFEERLSGLDEASGVRGVHTGVGKRAEER
jgi:hypothetical protein